MKPESTAWGPGPHHPAIVHLSRQRAEHFQLRLADKITAFAGSMPFIYLHVFVFGLWMLLLEERPWPTLTLAVSLEAIFLSTFVLIGQNRQAAFQHAKADHDYETINKMLEENTVLTRAIHEVLERPGQDSQPAMTTAIALTPVTDID